MTGAGKEESAELPGRRLGGGAGAQDLGGLGQRGRVFKAGRQTWVLRERDLGRVSWEPGQCAEAGSSSGFRSARVSPQQPPASEGLDAHLTAEWCAG